MSGTLHLNELKTNQVNATGNLVLMANGSKFITLNNASNNVEFHANVDANSFDFTDIDVIVGNIDNTPIGLNQQAQGKFSSLTATGNTFLNGNCTTSGHTQLSGGLLCNSTATFNNEVSFNASVSFEDFDVGDLNVSNIQVEANANVNGNATIGGLLQASGGFTCNSTATFNNPVNIKNELTIEAGGELDVSAGTLTLANDQISGDKIAGGTIAGTDINMTGKTLTLDNDAISGDKVNGGTIGSIRIENLSGAMDCDSNSMTNINVDSGNIDGVTIATSDITIGTGKTLNVSDGTLTLANNQISGDKVEGGTINSITIDSLGGALDCNNQAFSNVNIDSGTCENMDITIGTGKTLTLTAGTLNTSAAQKIAIVEGCASNLDIGNFLFRSQTLQADNQTEGRVCVYGSAGLLSEDANLTLDTTSFVCAKKTSIQAAFYRKAISTNEGGHSASKVLTANQVLSRLWRGEPNSALNITFPTAADLVAAMPNCVVGSIVNFSIMNLSTSGSGKDYTIVSGTGMNYVSTGTSNHNKVTQKKCKNFLVEITNIGSGTEAYNVYPLGDSTPV